MGINIYISVSKCLYIYILEYVLFDLKPERLALHWSTALQPTDLHPVILWFSEPIGKSNVPTRARTHIHTFCAGTISTDRIKQHGIQLI